MDIVMSAKRPCLMSIVLPLFVALGLASPAQAHWWQRDNPVVKENRLPGQSGWENDRPGYAYSDDANGEIAGYAAATSVNIGENMTLRVSVKPVQKFDVEIFRLGWYNGLGGRLVATYKGLRGETQPDCLQDAMTGLLECTNWSDSLKFKIPADWTTGIYVAMLTNENRYFRRVMFVVRNDRRTADILYQQPVTTYQAYNCWPCETPSGKSLYESSSSPDPIGFPDYNSEVEPRPNLNRAVKVSFDRPTRDQYGNAVGDMFAWEIYLVQWLERQGYDVSYSTNIDTHARGYLLRRYRAFLSVGHDEYWTKSMFDHVEQARDRGTNIGFMGANNVYWQSRLEPSSTGIEHRILVVYKNAEIDPATELRDKTIRWRDTGRAEQTLIGIQYTGATAINPNTDTFSSFIVQNSKSSFYRRTGLSDGDAVPGIIGYEMDRLFTDNPAYPLPKATAYITLGRSPFADSDENGMEDYAEASMYRAPSGALVFASGTMSWSWALGHPAFQNTGLQRLTQNILDRFVSPWGRVQ